MEKSVKLQLDELKTLKGLGLLDEESKNEIDEAIKILENTGNVGSVEGLDVKFINKSPNRNPEYATEGSAGFDFRAYLDKSLIVGGTGSGSNIKIIPTGLYFEIPEGFELQVRPRSGMAAKHGITVLNSPGTIDSDYRGEVKVILINHKDEDFIINPGDRIAQGVISSCVTKSFSSLVEVKELSETERGDGKFGSTGVK